MQRGFLLFFVFVSWSCLAADNPLHTKQVASQRDKWAKFYTFVPEKFDYYIELGSMWEKQNQYWLGGGFGRHIGRCVLSASQTCQQYWDLFGGAAGRDGQTTGLLLTGLRWQFVSFPKTYSPSLRLLGGVLRVQDDRRQLATFTYGLGYGVTTSVHKRVDLRLEARVGMADELWVQTMFSLHLKMDKWVDYFGSQIKQFGVDAIESTEKAFGDVFSAPNENKKGSESTEPSSND